VVGTWQEGPSEIKVLRLDAEVVVMQNPHKKQVFVDKDSPTLDVMEVKFHAGAVGPSLDDEISVLPSPVTHDPLAILSTLLAQENIQTIQKTRVGPVGGVCQPSKTFC